MTASGGSWCVNPGATISGNLTVRPGTTVVINGATIKGSVTASGGGAFSVCGSTLQSSLSVSGATGFVLVGDPGDDGCAGNTIHGSVNLKSNHAGVELSQNFYIGGTVTLSKNLGGGPFDDAAPEVEANMINGGLVCTGNSPLASDDGGQTNMVSGPKKGECAGAMF
jgi:hypothetical protein